MKKLVEKLGKFINGVPLMEGKEYDLAKKYFDTGVMPDGEKWPRGKPDIFVGYDGEIIVSNIKRKAIKGGSTMVTFDMNLSPGKPGGSGATIEAAASNHYFNLAGTEPQSIKGMKDAFNAAVKGDIKGIGEQLHKWFNVSDNWVWRIVGWEDRKAWTKPSVKITKIQPSGAMIDPTRRKWPSGRTEIWVPLKVSVQAEMKRK